jgi:hypothetical protein
MDPAQRREPNRKPATPVAGPDRFDISKVSSLSLVPVTPVAGLAGLLKVHVLTVRDRVASNAKSRWK